MSEAIKFTIVKVLETSIIVLSTELNQEFTLKLGRKVDIKTLKQGETYSGLGDYQGGWLFFVNPNKEEKKVEQRKEETKVVIPKAPEVPKSVWNDTKQDDILAQSTLKIATEITIAVYGNKTSLENVKGMHRDIFKYMKEKEYLLTQMQLNKKIAEESIANIPKTVSAKVDADIDQIELDGDII